MQNSIYHADQEALSISLSAWEHW